MSIRNRIKNFPGPLVPAGPGGVQLPPGGNLGDALVIVQESPRVLGWAQISTTTPGDPETPDDSYVNTDGEFYVTPDGTQYYAQPA